MRLCVFRIAVPLLLLSAIVCPLVVAQSNTAEPSDLQVDSGIHPYSAYDGAVSLMSGNLSFCIPIVQLPGRNGLDLDIPLCYNSQFNEVQTSSANGAVWDTLSYFPWVWPSGTPAMGPGWTLTGRPVVYTTMNGSGGTVLFMPDGSKKGFPEDGGLDSTDGETYLFPPNGVYFRNGTKLLPAVSAPNTSPATLTDLNSNTITFTNSSVTDSINRTVSVNSVAANGNAPTTLTFQYPTSNGTVSVAIQFVAMTFSCPQTPGSPPPGPVGATGTYSMPTSVALPNGLTYTFEYDSCGHLSKRTFPSGGYERYEYTYVPTSVWGPGQSPGSSSLFPYVATQVSAKHICSVPAIQMGATTTSQGNTCPQSELSTTYSPSSVNTDRNNEQNIVIDALGNKTVYQFTQATPSGQSFLPAVETSHQIWWLNNGTYQLQKSVTTDYTPNAAGNIYPLLPVRKTITLDDGQVSKTEWDYDFRNLFEADSPVTEQREFDYGTGAPGGLLRRTDYSWLQVDNPTVYSLQPGGIWFMDGQTMQTVYDGAGNLVADTRFQYNGTTLSTIKQWSSTDDAYLSTQIGHDGYGNIASITDPLGHQTTFDYTDNYSDNVSRNSFAYLTSITYPPAAPNQPALTEHRQYYYGSGLLAAQCGANASGACQINRSAVADYTQISYDNLGRVASISHGDGGSVSSCYSDNPGASCYKNSYPLQTSYSQVIATGASRSSAIVNDGLGRVTQEQLTSDPNCSSGSKIDMSYDADGRMASESNPYCSATEPTYGSSTYSYDALNRITGILNPDGTSVRNTYVGRAVLTADEGNGSPEGRERIGQFDALGNLSAVCELTASNQMGAAGNIPSSCGLDIQGSGFLTTYTHDQIGDLTSTTQGTSVRSFTYDTLARVTQTTNPESGTVGYAYDQDGDIVSRTDADGIAANYSYDGLNRLIGRSYPSTSFPSSCFQYDQSSTPNGGGRLTAEWTQLGACPSAPPSTGMITQRTLAAYDLMGHLTVDQQCSTPGNCNGTQYQVNYGYNLAGDLTTFTNGLSGSEAMSFTTAYDSGGRISTVVGPQSPSNPAPQNLFTGVAYTSLGALRDAALGSGIAVHRDYNRRLLPTDEIDTVGTTSGTAALQISGFEQVYAYSSGSISFSGSEQCSGSTCDGGVFLVTVGTGQPIQLQYGQTSSAASLASNLASLLTCSANSVQAVASGGTTYLQSCSEGTNTNYSISAYADGHSSSFAQYSFSVSTSGASMTPIMNASTGGSNVVTFSGTEQSGQTGNYVFFIHSTQNPNGPQVQTGSVSWNSSSTPSTLATALASSLGSCSSGQAVQGTAVGSTVYILACQSGATYTVSIELNFYSGGSGPSFTAAAGNAQLASVAFSGTEQGTQSGTFGLFISPPSGGPVAEVSWASGSTPSTLAAGLASALGSCSTNGNTMVGIASGATMYLAPCQPATTYSVSANLLGCGCGPGNGPSFSVVASNAGPSLPPVPGGSYDSGTLSLVVNGVQIATTSYGSSSNTASIVNALLASGTGNNLVALQANGSSLVMTAKAEGTYSDLPYQLTVSSSDPAIFSVPSFGSPNAAGSLVGGQNAPLYNWAINSYAPDGNVLSVSDSVIGNWSYGYDDLNRLVTANATAGPVGGMSLSWDYDRYGNRWDQNLTGSGSAVQTHFTFSGNNRIDGMSYDGNGSLLSDGVNSYAYNPDGQIIAINGVPIYIYDAEGNRVAKLAGGGSLTTVYILGLRNQQLTELDGSGSWKHSNIFVGDEMLATYEGPAGVAAPGYHYHLSDWLQSLRVQTNAAGDADEGCLNYPYGDGLSCTGNSPIDATEHHFTGALRDSESNLDYFGARYLNTNHGRWMTPDPSRIFFADPGNPQTLNLYGYAAGNPVMYRDKDGRFINFGLAAAGAGVGFVTGFLGSAITQEIRTGKVNWKTAGAYGVGGAVTGAFAGFTFGGSLLVAAAANVAVATSGSVVGGVVSRELAREPHPFDGDSIVKDAEVGFVGGAVGEAVGASWKMIETTAAPKIPNPAGAKFFQRLANTRVWEARQARLEVQASSASAVTGSLASNMVIPINNALNDVASNNSQAQNMGGSFGSPFPMITGDFTPDPAPDPYPGIIITVTDSGMSCSGCAGPAH